MDDVNDLTNVVLAIAEADKTLGLSGESPPSPGPLSGLIHTNSRRGDTISVPRFKEATTMDERTRWFEMYAGLVWSIITGKSVPAQDVWDVFQESWAAICAGWEKKTNTDEESTKVWICKITYNITMNYYRRKPKQRVLSDLPEGLAESVQPTTDRNPTEGDATYEEMLSALLAKLVPADAMAMGKGIAEGWGTKDYAKAWQLSERGARARLHKIRIKLCQEWERLGGDIPALRKRTARRKTRSS